jgi:3-hydroxybutyrate dehydrogenase
MYLNDHTPTAGGREPWRSSESWRIQSWPSRPTRLSGPAKWNAILDINLSAAFHGIATAVPQMKTQGWGRIVNIASAHCLVASTHKAAYVAAKHGLVGLTKVFGLETAGSDVTCNAVYSGWVRTPLVEKQISDIAA